MANSPTAFRWKAFTLVETLASVSVLVLSAGALFAFAVTAGLATQKLDGISTRTTNAIQVLDYLPEVLGRVRPPLWAAPESLVSTDGKVIRISYWEGDPKQFVEIRQESGTLTIQTPETSSRWVMPKGFSIDLWGIRHASGLRWREESGTEVRMPWGTQCL